MASPTHIDLTSPRRDEDGLGSTTPRVIPGDTTCTICLGRAFADPAAEPIFTWLICRHPLHLGCVANLRAHSQRPACLSCRQPWSMEGGSVFQELCTLHGVLIPDPPSYTQHRGETQRPPRPPPGILPLCCHRLFLANPGQAAQDEAWRELPDRNMHWAPHFDQRSQEWTSEWNCLRCNNTVTLEHALLQHIPAQPECPQHGPRTLAIDLRSNEGGSAPGAPTFKHARQPPCQQQRQRPHTDQNLPYHIGSGKGRPGTATSAPPIVGSMFHCSTPGG